MDKYFRCYMIAFNDVINIANKIITESAREPEHLRLSDRDMSVLRAGFNRLFVMLGDIDCAPNLPLNRMAGETNPVSAQQLLQSDTAALPTPWLDCGDPGCCPQNPVERKAMNIGDTFQMPYDGGFLPGIILGFRSTRYSGRQAIVDITYHGAVLRRHLYVRWLEKWAAQQANTLDGELPCSACGGEVGHRINCPCGIAFSTF